MLAAEDIQRQIAVAAIIAVKESAQLIAMDRVIRCVEVDNDTRRRLVIRTYEHIDKKVVGLAASENNLLIAGSLFQLGW